MASQRRAPTKRPPRPAAKKPHPSSPEGTDATESVTGNGSRASASAKSKTPKAPPPKTAPKTASPTSGTSAAKTVTPGVVPAKSATAKSTTAAKGGPATGAAKPGASGSGGANYRPPTGAARSRRPPPPPRKKKPWLTKKTVGAVVALALVASLVVFFAIAVNGSSGNTAATNAALAGTTPEGLAVPTGTQLASVDSARYPQTVEGIKCEATEQVVYHIHAHLSIFVNGQSRVVPYGIGIDPPLAYNTTNGTFVTSGTCFYWLHAHAADGIIHIESPTQTTYNLGQFFDLWGQPLESGRVGPAKGTVKVYVDGKAYPGDPRLIPLAAHTQIQLDVGSSPPAPATITFPSGL